MSSQLSPEARIEYPTFATNLLPAKRWEQGTLLAWEEATRDYFTELYGPVSRITTIGGNSYNWTPAREKAFVDIFQLAAAIRLAAYDLTAEQPLIDAFRKDSNETYWAGAEERYITQGGAEYLLLNGLNAVQKLERYAEAMK